MFLSTAIAYSAPKPPDYQWGILDYVLPSGAQRGTEVTVRFGVRNGGAEGATNILIDGPPGITVSDFKVAKDHVEARLNIAKDAALGRRMVRVHGGKGGLTNFRWFMVGALPEFVEDEKNDVLSAANEVKLPVIINGRTAQALDLDCFTFAGKKGQPLVAAIQSHAIDAMGFDRDTRGFTDLSLELLDADGRVLANAGDTIGFDPVIEHRLPADGRYFVRVSGLGYRGFPQATYRMTLGDIGYATAVYPAGLKPGQKTEVELTGYNLKPQKVSVSATSEHPVHYIESDQHIVAHDLAMFVGKNKPHFLETEPNNDLKTARPLKMDTTINARFLNDGDEDWYQLDMKKGDQVTLEIMAQRHFRSPVDTLIDVLDTDGKRITGDDDGIIFAGETTHDFAAFDSYLAYTAKKAGRHYFRITEQTGASGPRTVYRLSTSVTKPDLRLYHWPDVVPIWGPGTTGSFLVEVIRLGGLKGTVELHVEGLPKGWTFAVGCSHINDYRGPKQALGTKALVTISAPPDAKVGDLAEFRVKGIVTENDRRIERSSQALTLYMYSDPHKYRISPITRAVIAPPNGPWVTTQTTELKAAPGDELTIPVQYHDPADKPESGQIIVNIGRSHHIANFGSPATVKAGTKEFAMPLKIPANMKPGAYGLVVARQWGSNYRGGLPGPCTPVIRLEVSAK